jgi:hypothetical protein
MGEIVARAVYEGVLHVIKQQCGLLMQRSVLLRLKERGIHSALPQCKILVKRRR